MNVDTQPLAQAISDRLTFFFAKKAATRQRMHHAYRYVDASVMPTGRQVSIIGITYMFMGIPPCAGESGLPVVWLRRNVDMSDWYHDLRSFEQTAMVIHNA